MTLAEQGVPARRKWVAISLATLVMLISYWSVVLAFAAQSSGAADPIAPLALGIALIPFAYLVLAFVSNHQRAPMAVLAGMSMALVVGASVLFLSGDPVVSLVAGYGFGAVVSLRPEPGIRLRRRFAGAAAGAVAVWLLLLIAEPVGIFFAPAVPFTAVGLADGVLASSDEGE